MVTLNPTIKAQRSIHFVFGGDMNFEAWGRPFKFMSELVLQTPRSNDSLCG
jgi:hypothetical protein